MAFEQITQAVLDTARREAEFILKSAEKNVEDRLNTARKAAEQEAERRYQTTIRTIEEELAQKIIQLQGAANKKLLESKNVLLQKVFDQVRERILCLPEAEYAAIMKKLIHSSGIDCVGKLRVHPSETALFSDLLAEFNSGRSEDMAVGIDEQQALAERGGFIFVSDVFQVDQTLSTLLANIEHEMAPEISKELFSGQE